MQSGLNSPKPTKRPIIRRLFRNRKLLSAKLVIVIVVAAGTYFTTSFITQRIRDPCGSPTRVAKQNVQNDVIITCPANNSTVGRNFTITGTATYEPNAHFSVAVAIDGGGYDRYGLAYSPQTSVTKSGKFSIPIRLGGAKALQRYVLTANNGNGKYEYRSVSLGKHTFTVFVYRLSSADGFEINIPDVADRGPTLTLNVR